MPYLRRASTIALLAALFAFLLSHLVDRQPTDLATLIRGKNEKTILFFTLEESGQLNVPLATTQALLEKYPDFYIHFATFTSVREKVARVSSFARNKNPASRELVFHEISGIDHLGALQRGINCSGPVECFIHPPGARGAHVLAKQLEFALWPWSGEEHHAIYERCIDIMKEVDASLVVVDFGFRPAMDAVLHLSRLHAVISPNALADIYGIKQPYGAGLWKYPSWGTGFSFPVPWYQIPENIYVNLRLLYNLLTHPSSGPTVKYLRERKIGSDPLYFRPDVPFITQTLRGASLPLEVVPDTFTSAGAIVLDSAPAVEQDPDLVAWAERAPTIVVNLGSLFKYTQKRADIMAKAIEQVLAKSDIQVLWKMARNVPFGEDFANPLTENIRKDRVRIMDWLTVDTFSLLQIDNVIGSVHHGGASSYNEAVQAGVPQIVIPLWEDHYNFAQLVQDLGLGIYATRSTAPEWTVAGISEPILRILDHSDESRKRRLKAQEIGKLAQDQPGRYIAAAELVKWALSEQE